MSDQFLDAFADWLGKGHHFALYMLIVFTVEQSLLGLLNGYYDELWYDVRLWNWKRKYQKERK